jgi:LysM repeat protein
MPIGQYLNLYKVAEVAEVSYETLRKLNLGYKKGYLPHTSHTVNYLVLPAQGVEQLTAYLAGKNGKAIGGKKEGQVLVQYVVSPGDNLNSVAKLFQVEPADIRKWNHLKDGRLQAHQQLSLFLPKDYLLNRA